MVEVTLTSKSLRQSYFTLNNTLKFTPFVGVFVILTIVYAVLLVNKHNLNSRINETNELFTRNEVVVKKELGMDSYRLAGKTAHLSQTLSQRLYWSNIIGKFDNIFNEGTKVTDIVFDIKDFKIIVNASAPNYGAVEKQVSDLRKKKDLIQSVFLDSPSLSDNTISFKMEIIFNKGILKGPYL